MIKDFKVNNFFVDRYHDVCNFCYEGSYKTELVEDSGEFVHVEFDLQDIEEEKFKVTGRELIPLLSVSFPGDDDNLIEDEVMAELAEHIEELEEYQEICGEWRTARSVAAVVEEEYRDMHRPY